MLAIKIGEVRNKLSYYLRKVRLGQEVVISDRQTPVARLVPYRRQKEAQEPLRLIPPRKNPKSLAKLSFPALDQKTDSLKILLEDRSQR